MSAIWQALVEDPKQAVDDYFEAIVAVPRLSVCLFVLVSLCEVFVRFLFF